jgi:hypothetical protein
MTNDLKKQELIAVLKGARTIDLMAYLKREIIFLEDMKTKFGSKEKLVDATETRLRDLMWVFAKAANDSFSEEKQIGHGSLGLLTEPLERYRFSLLIEKIDKN